jgi:hypothetical protein
VTQKPQGWVFVKVPMPADLYARLQKAAEAMTGKPRSVAHVMRLMAEAVAQDVEAEQRGDEPPTGEPL